MSEMNRQLIASVDELNEWIADNVESMTDEEIEALKGKTLIIYLDDGTRVYAKHTEAPLLDQYMMETMLEAVAGEARFCAEVEDNFHPEFIQDSCGDCADKEDEIVVLEARIEKLKAAKDKP